MTTTTTSSPKKFEYKYNNSSSVLHLLSNPYKIETGKSENLEKKEKKDNKLIVKSNILGTTGLMNMGNTCFMNSVLQCLNQTIELKNHISDVKYETKLNKTIKKKMDNLKQIPFVLNEHITSAKEKYIVYQLIQLFNNLWNGTPIIRPVSFLNLFHEKYGNTFTRGAPADGHEALKCILDDVHEETGQNVIVHFKNDNVEFKRLLKLRSRYIKLLNGILLDKSIIEIAKKEYHDYKDKHIHANITLEYYKYWKKYIEKNKCSIISELFDGTILGSTCCPNCNKYSYAFSPTRWLTLPIPTSTSSSHQNNNITIQQCLELYSKSEKLDNDNKYNCSYCSAKVQATRELYIWRPAEVLIIHLSRFIPTSQPGQFLKNDTPVYYPLELDISPYISKLTFVNSNINKSCIYELYATTNHFGNYNGGHYTAHCKNYYDNMWYEYNDSSVTNIPIQRVMNNQAAYIIIYKPKQ